MPSNKAIFFDVDGVLLDSLPPHLKICQDKAKEYGLALNIPDEANFKKMVASGVKISPMHNFFHAVGFPRQLALQATREYEEEFLTRYRPVPFQGYDTVIKALAQCGCFLGIVTSNVLANIQDPLGQSLLYFDSKCIFTHDNAPERSKAWCLREGALRLGSSPTDCFYVGDLPSDAKAALDVGFNFIAAKYGWGFDQGFYPFATALSINDIPAIINRELIKERLHVRI